MKDQITEEDRHMKTQPATHEELTLLHQTPPWKVRDKFPNENGMSYHWQIISPEKDRPEFGHVTARATSEASADFIVRAVNAHDELLGAAKVALERWGKLIASAEIGEPNKVGDRLVKAIAKAEGK